MKIIDHEAVLDLIDTQVEIKGEDFVYQQKSSSKVCTYANGGKPDCLIGCVLHDLGVPIEVLEQIDNAEIPCAEDQYCDGSGSECTCAVETGINNPAVLKFIENETGLSFTPPAQTALSVAQTWQDVGHAWGEASRKAHEKIEGENS